MAWTEPWLGWLALQVWRLPTRVRASLNAGFPTGAEACVSACGVSRVYKSDQSGQTAALR